MTNPTIELIHNHSSARHYKPDPVLDSDLETIISAGQRASTSSNLQTYSVISVTDGNKKEQLAEFCGNQHHIRAAPVFLVWCADLYRMSRICEMRGYTQVTEYVENFLIAVIDAALAAQSAALAAESMGLGICYIGAVRNQPHQIINLLKLPNLVFPVMGMTVGWPEKYPKIRPRLPLEAVLHRETYSTDIDSYLKYYDMEMIAAGIYRGRQVPVPGSTNELENYGWLEHSASRASQPARIKLRQELEKQGFALK